MCVYIYRHTPICISTIIEKFTVTEDEECKLLKIWSYLNMKYASVPLR